MSLYWHFIPYRVGGGPGSSVSGPLEAAGMGLEEQLGREVIQNACDATDDPIRPDVEVNFRLTRVGGRARDKISELLGVTDGLLPRFREVGSALKLDEVHGLEGHEPIQLTFIEDFGTTGLEGDPNDPSSGSNRLLFSFGNTAKDEQDGITGGGSYGFGGKAVFTRASRVRTVVAYSVYERNGPQAQLLGAAWLGLHRLHEKVYSGWAWLGGEGSDDVIAPIVGDDAHDVAELLGFSSRRAGRKGTSLLIVDTALRADRILAGVEKWWWPRLVDQDLVVTVLDEDGNLAAPAPVKRNELRRFVECYNLATGKAGETANENQLVANLPRLRGNDLGRCALERVEEARSRERQDSADLAGTIALVRSPRMVVEYWRPTVTLQSAIGVFVAASGVDSVLQLAEPPNHDRWDSDATRLGRSGLGEQLAREIVAEIQKRLKRQFRSFARPDSGASSRGSRRLDWLEEKLGALLTAPSGGGRGDGSSSEPIEVRFLRGPESVASGQSKVKVVGDVRLRLREGAKYPNVEALLQIDARVAEAGTPVRDRERVPVHMRSESLSLDQPGQAQLILNRAEAVIVGFETEPYDPDWTVDVSVAVAPIVAK